VSVLANFCPLDSMKIEPRHWDMQELYIMRDFSHYICIVWLLLLPEKYLSLYFPSRNVCCYRRHDQDCSLISLREALCCGTQVLRSGINDFLIHCRALLQGRWKKIVPRNVDIILHHYTTSHTRRPYFWYPRPLSGQQNSQFSVAE